MRRAGIVALALVLSACGDPDTEDRRGYTKAPLENPGVLVGGEDATEMSRLGQPNRPRPSVLVEDPAPARPGGGEAGGAGEGVTLAAGVTQEQFDQGEQLFPGAGCQACHGPNGTGSQLGPDLTDEDWLHVSGPDVGEIADVIRSGVAAPMEYPAPMPPMGGANLTDDEVQALAAYVASMAQG